MLQFFPPVEYHGWDPSPAYIDRAIRRLTPNSFFNCGVFSEQQLERANYFDIVHSAGVLHHINDEEARQLILNAHAALKPGGKFFTLDGCFYPEQSRLAKFFLGLDRGKFVRDEPGYRLLAVDIFEHIQTKLYPKLIRPLPYPVLIMEMTKASCPD